MAFQPPCKFFKVFVSTAEKFVRIRAQNIFHLAHISKLSACTRKIGTFLASSLSQMAFHWLMQIQGKFSWFYAFNQKYITVLF